MGIQGPSALPFRPYVSAPRAAANGAAPAARAASAAPTANVEAPKDSSLWELLTDDERSFFSQQASLGALTYGRANSAAPAAAAAGPIGQRLDVRG